MLFRSFNILLQIMEDGRLTDSKGKLVDFKNTIIIMTSNIGAHTIKKQKSMGFAFEQKENTEYEKMKENIMEELKRNFRPEFLNRIDDTIVFHKLNKDDMLSIVGLMLKSTSDRLKNNSVNIDFNENCKEFLLEKGIDENYGARPLRRIITKEVEDKLSEELLKGHLRIGDKIAVSVRENQLNFKKVEKETV